MDLNVVYWKLLKLFEVLKWTSGGFDGSHRIVLASIDFKVF